MTVTMRIHEAACRGCRLCVDTCPTEVLDYDEAVKLARPSRVEDCIGCLTCAYHCPAGAITHDGVHLVRNFYRDLDHVARLGRFL